MNSNDSTECTLPLNPVVPFLRTERMPHIWCPGCGIGTTVNCFARAVMDCGIPLDELAIVSGIGCTGRVAGYLKLDSFHTTHGRAIPFATGLKLSNPKLHVVVYSGDGDLAGIGGNHFIHAARRNLDLTVILVNNFTYAMTGGQATPTAPKESIETTAPYGVFEEPFNLPHLAASSGAVYVARWTAYHVVQTKKAILEALQKKGFVRGNPCPLPHNLLKTQSPWWGRRRAEILQGALRDPKRGRYQRCRHRPSTPGQGHDRQVSRHREKGILRRLPRALRRPAKGRKTSSRGGIGNG